MDSISAARLQEVHPVLSSRVTSLIDDCESNGLYLRVTQGKRSPNQQHALYMQGRASLEIVNDLRHAVGFPPILYEENQEVVTHADWLDSMHCYGLAVDVDPSEGTTMAPFNPDWDTQDPQWQKVLAIALNHGLAEGAQWTSVKRDYPHLFPQELAANPTEEMKQTYKDAGLQSVWNALNLS
jgi:peptidoglycan L-alanyl-D-glutamate endopeptidase CwlK